MKWFTHPWRPFVVALVAIAGIAAVTLWAYPVAAQEGAPGVAIDVPAEDAAEPADAPAPPPVIDLKPVEIDIDAETVAEAEAPLTKADVLAIIEEQAADGVAIPAEALDVMLDVILREEAEAAAMELAAAKGFVDIKVLLPVLDLDSHVGRKLWPRERKEEAENEALWEREWAKQRWNNHPPQHMPGVSSLAGWMSDYVGATSFDVK